MEINEPLKAEALEHAPVMEGGITREGAVGFVFALALLVISYLLICIFPVMLNPLGFLILTAALYAITTVSALLLKARPGVHSIAALILGLVTAMYRMVHGYVELDLFPIMFIALFIYAYYVLSLFVNHSGRIGGGLLMDIVKGIVYMFVSFHEFFIALFKPKGSRRRPYAVLLVMGGILAAALLVVIVASLLSYDANFKALLPQIDIDSVPSIILKISFAVPLAAMLFSVNASSRKGLYPALSSEETVSRVGSKVKVIPVILVILPAAALLVIYALFFVSQWAYYVSAFTRVLPDGFSAAEYAREGFFQLCAVTCINLILIFVLSCFMRIRSKSADVLRRVFTVMLSAATLILIATAVSKMLLYIERYDLTRARLEATVFLLFLAAVFTAVIVAALFKRVKALPMIAAAAILFFTAYSLVNTNRFIASYNVDAYLSGKHDSIDVDYLRNDLGWSSVPELKRLSENAGGDVQRDAEHAYNDLRSHSESVLWYEGEIPYYEAKKSFGE